MKQKRYGFLLAAMILLIVVVLATHSGVQAQRSLTTPLGPEDTAAHSVYEIRNFSARRNPSSPMNWIISFDVKMPPDGWAEVEYFTDDGYWKRAGIFYNTSREETSIPIVVSDQINKPRFRGWRVRAKCKDGTTVTWR